MVFVVNKIWKLKDGESLINEAASVAEYLTPSGNLLYFVVNVNDKNKSDKPKPDRAEYIVTPSGLVFEIKKQEV